MKFAQQTHLPAEIASAFVILAKTSTDGREALKHLITAHGLYVDMNDQVEEADTAMLIARLASKLGNSDLAIEHYQRANELYKALGQRANAAVATRELNKLKGGGWA